MEAQPMVLVFVGCHGSGKSTLGRETARVLGWQFDPEIGDQLRQEALNKDGSAHAVRPQDAFDIEVFRRESARDIEHANISRVVETWHPGNLAYALKRSPQVALEEWCRLKRHIQLGRARVLVQPLEVSSEVLQTRLTEPGPEPEKFVPWLLEVGSLAQNAGHWLGLEVAPSLNTDNLSVDEAVERVVERVRGLMLP